MVNISARKNLMNESNPSDAALAELLTLTVEVDEYGTTYYRNQQGQLHRIHGPAIIYPNGSEYWFRHGERHRTDGPAINWANGTKWWYLYDNNITESEFNEQVKSI